MRYAVICSLGMMVWLAGIPALAMEEHSGHEGHGDDVNVCSFMVIFSGTSMA